MKIGFMGRTKVLIDAINLITNRTNHKISFIWTSKAEAFYNCNESNFKTLAKKNNCPFILSAKLNKLYYKYIKNVDVVISVNFKNIIPENFLKYFKYGIINAHAGDLPNYKGNACPNWAILNKEKEIVLTIHKMTSELDSGPIYLKKKYKLTPSTYITDVYDWLHNITPDMLLQTLEMIEKKFKPKKQKKMFTVRTFPRIPEDSKIDWSTGVENIYRLIRASSKPFDGAFSYIKNTKKKIKIFKAKPIKLDYKFYAIDGQVVEFNKEKLSFIVASKNKAIMITEYRIDGLSQKQSFEKLGFSINTRLK